MQQTLALAGLGLTRCLLESCSVTGAIVMFVQTLLRTVKPLPAEAEVVQVVPVWLSHPV